MLDSSVFKRLAHNDTGKARGHQGGIVIPKDIAQFFPPLPPVTAATGPTVDVTLTADIFIDGVRAGAVRTRYQHQTWGGTRSPERRLTDNLGALRNAASAGDILLFSKDLAEDGHIQLRLVRKEAAEYARLMAQIGERRSGPLDPSDPPVSVQQMEEAERYIEDEASRRASAFDSNRGVIPTLTVRRARDRAFRRKVLDQYGGRCAFTGRSFVSPGPGGVVGLDGAHVVPVAAWGSDHAGNGLPLTKDMHWAFDRGLIGVATDRTMLVPADVRGLPGNEFLRDLHGKPIREAKDPAFRVLEEALKWHRKHILIG